MGGNHFNQPYRVTDGVLRSSESRVREYGWGVCVGHVDSLTGYCVTNLYEQSYLEEYGG